MKKILTLIIDGIGFNDGDEGNAFKAAKTETFDKVFNEYPFAKLEASGEAIGLSENQPGNSTIGYETITSGQKLRQKSSYATDFTDIDSLATNTPIKNMIEHIKEKDSTLHIMGLMSDGGVNSNIKDTINVINFLKTQNIKMVVDFISDGKDVETKSALKYIKEIEETGVPIATVCGRYYAMDSEEKWDRTKIYYDLVRDGNGLKVEEIEIALRNCYMRNITDEYLPPIILKENTHLRDDDAILWMNYEGEKSKQILLALTNAPKVTEFTAKNIYNLRTLLLYPVDSSVDGIVLIHEEEDLSDNIGSYISKLDLSQARIADEEYFDYVTYYFNGKSNKKIPKCTNFQISVPKTEENREAKILEETTKQIIKCMEKDTDFIVASLNEIDKSGHTGDFEKTKEMVEFTDACLNKIMASAEMNFYKVVILSTHGNSEEMSYEENKPKRINTTNRVPFLITDKNIRLDNGTLINVAPTLLTYMDLAVPESMKHAKILIRE